MKITVDTNILIAATFWSGSSEKIIKLSEKNQLDLILSRPILDEYQKVLEYDEIKEKIIRKNLSSKYPLKKLESFSNIVSPKKKIEFVKEDPDDNIIIECADEGKVDFIISLDKHLLKLKNYKGIPIVTPDNFLKKYSK